MYARWDARWYIRKSDVVKKKRRQTNNNRSTDEIGTSWQEEERTEGRRKKRDRKMDGSDVIAKEENKGIDRDADLR